MAYSSIRTVPGRGPIERPAGDSEGLGQQLLVQKTGIEREIDVAFEALAQEKVDALLVAADPFFNSWRPQIVALARRHAVPAIYQWSGFVTDGGLMSYGPSIADAYHRDLCRPPSVTKPLH